MTRSIASGGLLDVLEPRRLLSTITWVNRGMASDRFGEVFGGQANLARGVIDAALMHWQRVINDFNYSDGSNTYEVLIAMRASGEGFGAVAGSTATIPPVGGKPSEGTMVFDRGSDTDGDDNGDGEGWFLDPTPFDSVEYNGTQHNAFAANAAFGSPAFLEADLLTVAMHELGHALGLDANDATGAFDSDTGQVDPQGAGAHFWAFEGPSVSHLFTGYDSSGATHNGTQHSARPTANVNFDGQNWRGAVDLMNPTYANSQRKLVSNVYAWVLQDAWDYDITLPESFNTFHSMLDQDSGGLVVRGAFDNSTASDDEIEIGLFGPSLLVVSVDIGQDVPGTGPLPGAGNLDSFVSIYNVADVSSILVQGGDGNDSITINSLPLGVGLTIEGGSGDDTVTLGSGDLDTNLNGAITFFGNAGADALILDDTTDGSGSDSYTFTTTTLTKPVGDNISWATIEAVTLNASPNSDSITVNGTLPGTLLTVNARGGDDVVNVQVTDLVSAAIVSTGSGSDTVNVNTDDTGIALAIFPATENATALNIGVGGRLVLAQAALANSRALVTQALSIDNGGVLDLTNGSMIIDYAGASPFNTIRNWIASGRNDGAWTGSGITSFAAFSANPANTTLGILPASQYFALYGNGTPFAGQTIDSTSVLVKYTYYGDTDFSGSVDFDDYVRTDSGYNNGLANWLNGDFDLSGAVDFDDYVLLDLGLNTQGPVL